MSRKARAVGYLRVESVAFSIAFMAQAALKVWRVTGGPTFVDETSDFNDAGPANLNPFDPAAPVTGDYAAFGFATKFGGMTLDNAGGTAGVGAGDGFWEYWNGAWVSLPGLSDGTFEFTAAVSDGQEVTWTVPGDWATTTLNGQLAYYVRFRIGTTTFSTSPVYDQGFIDVIETISLDDDVYFPEALAAEIQSKVIASHVDFANFTCSVSATTGIFSMALGGGETGTITWDSTSTELRDWMRYAGATLALSSTPQDGSRSHAMGVYFFYTAITDLPVYPANAWQTRGDGGKVWTISLGELEERRLKWIFKGGPRSAVYTEYSALLELFRLHIRLGRRWRWYPDVTVAAAFVEVDEPFGYHELKAKLPLAWNPTPAVPQWYERFEFEMECFKFV